LLLSRHLSLGHCGGQPYLVHIHVWRAPLKTQWVKYKYKASKRVQFDDASKPGPVYTLQNQPVLTNPLFSTNKSWLWVALNSSVPAPVLQSINFTSCICVQGCNIVLLNNFAAIAKHFIISNGIQQIEYLDYWKPQILTELDVGFSRAGRSTSRSNNLRARNFASARLSLPYSVFTTCYGLV